MLGINNNQATKHWIEVVQGNYASPPTTYDFDNVGAVTNPTEGASRYNYDPGNTDVTTNQYNTRSLNATGLGWISKTGTTTLGLRQGNDSDNTAVYAYPQDWEHRSEIQFASSETAGTSQDPYLEIAYTLPNNSPTAPTGLLCESTSTPENIRDPYPEFSAVYTDPNTTDIATSYQIQIATSTAFSYLFWDSNKTNISSTTPQGTRCPDVTYSGPTIPFNDNTYFWRIRFWDENDNTGDWSTSTASFTTSRYLQHLSYAYDSTGNITSIADISDTNASKTMSATSWSLTYAYDDLNRLITASTTGAASGQDYKETFEYGPTGNILNKNDQGNYLYQGNQGASYCNPAFATSINGQGYSCDNNGNLTNDGTWTHHWDYDNRIASSTNGTATITYGYGADGQRVMMSDGTNTTYYPNKYYSVSGATTTKYIFANDVLIATIESNGSTSTIRYVHTDHLGGTGVTTDENGNEAQSIIYYPFGEVKINENSSTDEKHKFTGHIHDDSTGLEYMNARYNKSSIGRFISADPMAMTIGVGYEKMTAKLLTNPQEQNYYSYALNNPLKFVDPTGLFNKNTGQIEKGDTPQSITTDLNKKWGTNYTWSDIVVLNPDQLQGTRFEDTMGRNIVPNNRIPDVTIDLTNRMRSCVTDWGIENPNYFYNKFKNNGGWDLKNTAPKYSSKTHDGFVFDGKRIDVDAPGNMLYGYVGSATIWSTPEILHMAAGYAQIKAGTSRLGWMNTTYWGDDPADYYYINYGIQLFNRDFR